MKGILQTKEIKVGLDFGDTIQTVGRLAIRGQKIYFEYAQEFMKSNLEISPLRLPLKTGLTTFDSNLFEGLPGIFNDSLPDGWGRLLFDRFARSQGVQPASITPLDRLAHIGHNGLGALVFEPDFSSYDQNNDISLDILSRQAQDVLDGTSDDVLAELIALNGSSAGARPKALIGIDETRNNIIHGVQELPDNCDPWIVKFANNYDGDDAGAIEYVYALMAKEAGIEMPDVHLFPAEKGAGYFAIKRFDRLGRERLHMHTACGLLHSDFRTPSLDYDDLLTLTAALTRDVREVEKMYRLAAFNVLAHNRDDHAKNFSFLMNSHGDWNVSPGYDLTFSSGPNGEQSTMVMGEGGNSSIHDLIKLGNAHSIPKAQISEIIERTKASLGKWQVLAKEFGVSKGAIKEVLNRITGMT